MKTVIYTHKGWVNDNLHSAEALKDRLLWVADYKSTQTPVIPPQWPTWTFWQFSETGSVFGVNNKVDLNRSNGLSADLKRLGKGVALGAVTT